MMFEKTFRLRWSSENDGDSVDKPQMMTVLRGGIMESNVL